MYGPWETRQSKIKIVEAANNNLDTVQFLFIVDKAKENDVLKDHDCYY